MTTLLAPGSEGTPPVRIGRQGIFDADGRLVAHELLFRGTSVLAADLAPPDGATEGGRRVPDTQDRATSQVISATFGDFGVQHLAVGKPLYLNLTRPFLVGEYPLPFGPDGVVLEILEHVPVDEQLLAGLRGLRARGFSLAADDFTGEADRMELLPLVDVIKIDVLKLQMPVEELVAICRRVAPSATLLAERVEDAETLQRFAKAGCTLFQGFLFERPFVLETARMSPSQLVCVRLLRALSDPDSSIEDLERIISADPGLSLRVLRTANSAGSGSTRQITSLRQAVVMLGPVALSAWVMLTLVGGLGSGRREDLVLVLTRASTCERLAADVADVHPSAAFTAGLLSGVATVLGTSTRQVAAGAGLPEDVTEDIAEGRGPLGSLVRSIECHEREDDAGVIACGVSVFEVSRAYLHGFGAAMATVAGVLGNQD